MKNFPREYTLLAERILADYPERVKELEASVASDGARFKWLEAYVGMVGSALRLLTDKEREVIKLLYWDGLRVWETADLLETYEKAIWRTKTRGLQKMLPTLIPHLLSP